MTVVGAGKYIYEVREDWARYPKDLQPAMAAVAVDSQDRVYGFHRGDPAVIIFDRLGDYLGSWGSGIAFAHAITIDWQDNVWLADRNNCQVFKFTRDGKPLMVIGTKGHRSDTGVDPADFSSQAYRKVTRGGGPFNLPAGTAIAPSGEVFIADGYANCRVHRFSPEGKLILSWGEPGDGPGQFRLPHGVWVDRRGRVLVADRENDRVQVFTQEGQLLAIWPTRLIGPAAFYVDGDDVAYVPEHNGGYFSVLTLDGQLLARWGEEAYRSCHGVAGDSHGDIWHPEGYLLFVDIRQSLILRLGQEGQVEVARRNSGGANGLTFDLQGRLVMCEGDNRRVTRMEADGSIVVLAERWEGKRLNRPNDVVCRSDGSIYFTDPAGRLGQAERELGFSGVFRVAPDGSLSPVATELEYPNGLAFSPDESTLYVANTRQAMHVRAYDVRPDGSLANGRTFADMSSEEAEGVPDGMKVDLLGRVYCTGPGGCWVFDPFGNHPATIRLPEVPANCAWGGPDGRTMYFTARTSVYSMRMKTAGVLPPWVSVRGMPPVQDAG